MKKLMTLFLCILMVFGLAACGDSDYVVEETATPDEETVTATDISPTEATEIIGNDDLSGVWYKDGDENADTYFTFRNGGSCDKTEYGSTTTAEFNVTQYECAAPTFDDITIGDDYYAMAVQFDDSFFSNDLTYVAGNNALISFSDGDMYIHQNALDNEAVLLTANLLVREWSSDDEDSMDRLYFYPNNSVAYSESETGTIKQGIWDLIDNNLSITWEDGEVSNGTITLEGNRAAMTLDNFENGFNNRSMWD